MPTEGKSARKFDDVLSHFLFSFLFALLLLLLLVLLSSMLLQPFRAPTRNLSHLRVGVT